MEADQPAGTVAPFHCGRRAIHTAPPRGRQRTANHSSEPLDRAPSATGFQHFDGPDLVRTSESSVLDRSAAAEKTGSMLGRICRRIDAVLISHNHYDHLDLPTLRRLAARGDSTFIVPAGVARLLRSENIGPVHELDWGEIVRRSRASPSTASRLCISPAGEFSTATDAMVRVCDRMPRSGWYISRETPRSDLISPRFGKSSDRRTSRYCRSERTSRAGSCRRCIWLPMRR